MLICGYKGSGKDTLFEVLSAISKNVKKSKFKLHIFKKKETPIFSFDAQRRDAFADKLKECVHKELKYEEKKDTIYSDKDNLLVQHPSTGIYKTLRGWYIEYAASERKKDPDVFAKQVIFNETTVITDFRFKNEYEYLKNKYESDKKKIITARIFRSCVGDPGNEPTERNLDDFETDYLFLARGEDLEIAQNIFDVYDDFVYSETIPG